MADTFEDFQQEIKQVEKILLEANAKHWIERSKDKLEKVEYAITEYKQRHNDDLDVLEEELYELKTKEQELAQVFHELEQREQHSKKEKGMLEWQVNKQKTDTETITKEIEALESEIQKVDSDQQSATEVSSMEIGLALYEVLGVKAIVEDKQLSKIKIESYDRKTRRVYKASSYATSINPNAVWKIISKGCDE